MAKWDKPFFTRGIGGIGGQPRPIPVESGWLEINPVYGSDPDGAGVTGCSNMGPGVMGRSVQNWLPNHGGGQSDGVLGESGGNGVHGVSTSTEGSGVRGENNGGGFGVQGSTSGAGLPGLGGASGAGVWGNTQDAKGVMGTSTNGVGVYGWGGAAAGVFDGDVIVNGKLQIGSQGDIILNDCAEHFDAVDAETEPGTVMVIDQDGNLRPSDQPYDKKVAGVVSGAGNFKPGIILGKPQSQGQAMLIALLGKVFCKVDAGYAAIEIGDLLTTSPTSGHAMKAQDPLSAFGAVIGKALKPLKEGQGLIPILVALQ